MPDAGSQPDHAVDAEPQQQQVVAVAEQPQEEVTCSLCDQVFVYPINTACPMCGEAYGAPADDAAASGQAQSLNEEGPRQVECSLCDHPYEYPTLRECPMCGEAYGAPADEPSTTSNAAAAAAPGSITAMLMQLQQSVQAQQDEQQQADNARLEQLRLEEEHDKRPKSIEEESKRMVMCGHCGHTYEYPTYNFCDNCGHPSSNASLRLSQIKRQTWAQGGRQSMQIGAGAIEQMLAAAAANGGSGGGGDGQELPGMINFCPDCGTSTDGGSQRFCGMCGKSFRGDEPALPELDVPTSPTSGRHETGERDKLKKKNKSWGKKTSYRTYFTEVSSSPITSRVKKFSKRGRDDKSSRTIEVKSDWQHMVAASLPSTPDAISAYKQMMIAKYEAQQKENVFIRSTSRRGSAEFRSLDAAAMGAYRQDASEDGSLSPRGGYQQAPLSPRSPRVGGGSPYAHTSTSFRAHASSPNLISSPSASYRIAVGHQEIDQQIGAVLAELNLAKYGTAFAQEEVTYDAFLLLEADDLTQMGIPIGPRKLILAKILELKQ